MIYRIWLLSWIVPREFSESLFLVHLLSIWQILESHTGICEGPKLTLILLSLWWWKLLAMFHHGANTVSNHSTKVCHYHGAMELYQKNVLSLPKWSDWNLMNLPLHQRFKIKGKLISLAMRINELVVKLSFKLVNKKCKISFCCRFTNSIEQSYSSVLCLSSSLLRYYFSIWWSQVSHTSLTFRQILKWQKSTKIIQNDWVPTWNYK